LLNSMADVRRGATVPSLLLRRHPPGARCCCAASLLSWLDWTAVTTSRVGSKREESGAGGPRYTLRVFLSKASKAIAPAGQRSERRQRRSSVVAVSNGRLFGCGSSGVVCSPPSSGRHLSAWTKKGPNTASSLAQVFPSLRQPLALGSDAPRRTAARCCLWRPAAPAERRPRPTTVPSASFWKVCQALRIQANRLFWE
jgi:hypothetical protein